MTTVVARKADLLRVVIDETNGGLKWSPFFGGYWGADWRGQRLLFASLQDERRWLMVSEPTYSPLENTAHSERHVQIYEYESHELRLLMAELGLSIRSRTRDGSQASSDATDVSDVAAPRVRTDTQAHELAEIDRLLALL
jgi:hypothetical protein